MKTDKLYKLIDIWYIITVTVLLYLAVKYALFLILPFVLAIIVAAALHRPVDLISSKFRIKQSVTSFICVTMVLLLLLTALSALTYSIYSWLSDILRKLPDMLPQISKFTTSLLKSIPFSIEDYINEIPSLAIENISDLITGILSKAAKTIPSSFITLFVTVLAAYIVTRDYAKLGIFIQRTVSESKYCKLIKIKEIMTHKTVGMIKGYAILTAVTFALLTLGFLLLKVKHAFALAAITAFIDLLPIFGTGIVLIPWGIWALISGNIPIATGLFVLYAIITIVHNILSPKIVGNHIKLDSLTVLASMYIGFRLTGVAGLIFAPFTVAVIRDIIMDDK